MWNKLAYFFEDPSYKRLVLAIFASVLVHMLLFGGVDLSLPIFKKEMHTIEARLQMPKAVVKQANPAKAEPEVVTPKAKKSKKTPIEPVEPAKTEEVPPAEVPETTNPTPVPEIAQVAEPATPAVAQAPEVIKPEPTQTEQPVDQGLVINENAYRYVEIEYNASTKIDGPAEGEAKLVYSLGDHNQYQLKFTIEPKGLAALIIPDLIQTSDGLLTKTGLQPIHYTFEFGDKAKKSRKAMFDWQANSLTIVNKDGEKTEKLLEGTQDLISFMLQFMYVAPLQQMEIPITNGKNLRIYDYSFEGEALVLSPLGEVKAMHIVHNATEAEEKTELWLAIDYQYLPVKIRKTNKDGKVYEFIATRINSNRPTIDNPQTVK